MAPAWPFPGAWHAAILSRAARLSRAAQPPVCVYSANEPPNGVASKPSPSARRLHGWCATITVDRGKRFVGDAGNDAGGSAPSGFSSQASATPPAGRRCRKRVLQARHDVSRYASRLESARASAASVRVIRAVRFSTQQRHPRARRSSPNVGVPTQASRYCLMATTGCAHAGRLTGGRMA